MGVCTEADGADTTYVSIDVEEYEFGCEILEVGIAWAKTDEVTALPVIHSRYLVVADHLHLHNGRHVADHREEYNFGVSEHLPLDGLAAAITEQMHHTMAESARVYLAGHSIQGDLRWLKGTDLVTVLKMAQAWLKLAITQGSFSWDVTFHRLLTLVLLQSFDYWDIKRLCLPQSSTDLRFRSYRGHRHSGEGHTGDEAFAPRHGEVSTGAKTYIKPKAIYGNCQ